MSTVFSYYWYFYYTTDRSMIRIRIYISLLLLPIAAHASDREPLGQTKQTISGDSITFSQAVIRTITVNGQQRKVIYTNPQPILLNHKPISYDCDPVFANNIGVALSAIIFKYQDQIEALATGVYSISINNIVVNETGNVVYLEMEGLAGYSRHLPHLYPGMSTLPQKETIALEESIANAIYTTTFPILEKDGVPTSYQTYYRSSQKYELK